MPGKPLQLVRCETNGRLVVGEEAAAVLRAVKGPLAVVAVCGRSRQGKSFILNQIASSSGQGAAKANAGFEVAATHKPCTKGLWLWSKPIPRQDADGSKYHIVLLDSEGIDAYDQTGQYSTQIFSLAVLLSSLFVYNQMGGIDEAALDRLSLVTEMSKRIAVRAEDEPSAGAGAAALGATSPHFLWLLRDFFLHLSEDGEAITAKDYLELALTQVKGSSAAVAAKNQIRESIRSLFPLRDCYTLVRPMNDEAALQNLGAQSLTSMRPEFQAGMTALLDRVYAKALPKRLGSSVLTGPMLAGLASTYVDAINNGAVPVIATAWQGVAEAECRAAVEEAEAAYTSALDPKVTADEEALSATHQRALEAALAVFHSAAVGDPQTTAAFEAKLMAAAKARFAAFKVLKQTEAVGLCAEQLLVHERRLRAAAAQADATPAVLVELIRKELHAYDRATAGPAKWHKAALFLADEGLASLVRCAETREEKVGAMLKAATAAAAAAETEARKAVAKAAELEKAADTARNASHTAEVQLAKLTEREASAAADAKERRRETTAATKDAAAARAEAMAARAEATAARGEAQLKAAELEALRGTAAEAMEAGRAQRNAADDALRRCGQNERMLAAAEAEVRLLTTKRDEARAAAEVALATVEREREEAAVAAARLEVALAEQKQATRLMISELQTKEEAWKAAETATSELEVKLREEIAALKAEPKAAPSAKAAPKAKAKAAPKAKAAAKAVPIPSDDDDDNEMPFADAVEVVEPEIQVEAEADKTSRKVAPKRKRGAAAAEGGAAAQMTVKELKEALTAAGFAAEVWPLKKKPQLLKLYEEKMP